MVWRSRPAPDASQQETRKNEQILNHVRVFKKKTIDGVTFPPRQAKAAISRAAEIGWIMLLFFFFMTQLRSWRIFFLSGLLRERSQHNKVEVCGEILQRGTMWSSQYLSSPVRLGLGSTTTRLITTLSFAPRDCFCQGSCESGVIREVSLVASED